MTDQTVGKVINFVIDNFIDEISKKYNINKIDLEFLWNKSNNNGNNKGDDKDKVYTESQLNSLLKNDIISICKSKGIKFTGKTKKDLIVNILNVNNKEKQENITKPIFQSIIKQTPVIQIHRNNFGNFEHSETCFVFNNKTQKVIGKQNKNGDIDALTKDDIDICNKYKFSYIIPENLDSKNNSDVYVEGLEEEDEEFEYEEEEEEIVDDIVEEEEDFNYEEDE